MEENSEIQSNIQNLKSYYFCTRCQKQFSTRSGLWKHNKKSHCVTKKIDSDLLVAINENLKKIVMQIEGALSKQST